MALVRVAAAIWLLGAALGAEETPPIRWDSPEGWSQERIELPPSFAPAMSLKGFEEIRFAPGMFQPDSDSFFSYVIILYLPDAAVPATDVLTREIMAYYRGLAGAVAKGRGRMIDVEKFQLALAAKSDDPPQQDIQKWTGTLS